MQALINDLLAYSRVGTKARPFQPTDCNEIVDIALGNLLLAIKETGALIRVGPLPRLMGDPSQLRQLFQNLIANAIKFRRAEPPTVDISAEPAGDAWRFRVTDNGIGIAEEYHERIFVLFQRLHGRADYPGTGIGLAICKKIVERHGGEISLQSTLGGGTTFFFNIAQSPRTN
jgi:light-regulated signal transduction histidine kinase (bacteriophytochrome)